MSFGATLRVLRLQSGMGLRDLARRLGVSSTYLSRIENDIDPAPTPARLTHIAHELGVSATTLIEIARRVGPLLTDYVEAVPEAGSLFADLALRKLTPAELAEVQSFVDRRFARRFVAVASGATPLVELIAEERLVLGLRCAQLTDALQIAAGRHAAESEHDAPTIGAALISQADKFASGIGKGVAVVCAALPERHQTAALTTFSAPLAYRTPDGRPLRVLVTLVGAKGDFGFSQHVADIARLADRGLAEALSKDNSASNVLSELVRLSRTQPQ
jgi:nitrogen PTS system EIIA component